MKCLSVRQPFAWAILKGKKRVENRSRPTNHHGPILLHAGKTPPRLEGKLSDGTPMPRPSEMPLGAIVGAVVIVDCMPFDSVDAISTGKIKIKHDQTHTILDSPKGLFRFPKDSDFRRRVKAIADDPFTCGPECILLESPIEFEKPIPYSGQVGLFNVDEKKLDLAAADRKRLEKLLKSFR